MAVRASSEVTSKSREDCVAVLAPLGRDATVLAETLATVDIPVVTARNVTELVARISDCAGTLLLTEEALSPSEVRKLLAALGEQPSWSDLPIVLLLAEAASGQAMPHLEVLTRTGTVLERPVPALTLVTAVQASLRARRRQYQVRDSLARERVAREQAEQALQDREEALRSREEVLGIVSHDLRNPLNAVALSATSLLDELHDDPQLKRYIDVIHRSAERMEHMINDLLDMATIEAKGLKLDRTKQAADAIITSVIDAHEAMARTKGIELRRESELRSVWLSCDRDRIEQVFGNLIGNALKYCGSGDEVSLRGAVLDQEVRFTIADTGPGIPPAELPHLFERYWTVKRQGTKKGTGLGLYICKGIVEAHGGRLWVDSTVGHGTSFSFTLPRAAPPHSQASDERIGSPG